MHRIIVTGLILAEAAAAVAAAWICLPNLYHSAVYRVDVGVSAVSYVAPAMLAGVLIAAGLSAYRGAKDSSALRQLSRSWLPLLVNALIVVRHISGAKAFFLEPVLFAISLGASLCLSIAGPGAKDELTEGNQESSSKRTLPLLLILAAAALAAVWFYFVQAEALSRISLGYADAGIYYLRVKNTAIGRGLLQETMARPPFYDHFDVGLLVLVPFWWLIKSYKTVMWAQAVFLAAVGPAVYVYARGRGSRPWAAFAFGASALMYPSISQMSLSFSYGFHPVTLAIPAVILSMHFLEKRRWGWFAAAALFAMSMEETIIPLYVGMGLVEAVFPRGARRAGLVLTVLSAGAFVLVTRVIIPEFAGSGRYFQMAKFEHLGKNAGDILLSPFAKPGVFWGLIFSRQSLVFLALLLGSLGFLPTLAPRQLLYPAIVVVFVLLLQNPDVKSISFQYQAMIVAAWLPAAVAGAARLSVWLTAGVGRAPGRTAYSVAFAAAAVALLASHFYGMLPWSRMTVPVQTRRNDAFMTDARAITEFAASTPRTARVLATMRVAALFVEALEVAPLQEWTGRTDYDVVVLQPGDQWGARQSEAEQRAVYDCMAATGGFEVRKVGPCVVMTRKRPEREALR